MIISIHALREEGDLQAGDDDRALGISIHALREEGDRPCASLSPRRRNFYPRPPRGGRPHTYALKYYLFEFLSTPSARRATGRDAHKPPRRGISIHALREEGDEVRRMAVNTYSIFLSTPHALREEGDVGVETSTALAL